MPRRDGTGPMGQGAMTGRGLGNCESENKAVYGMGRGFGCSRRSGFGRGNGRSRKRMNAGFTDQELLEEEKAFLQNRLNQIEELLKA